MLKLTKKGLECQEGNFFIDPWGPVETALITHAHGDHARRGSKNYIAHWDSLPILKYRLGEETQIRPVEYGQKLKLGNVWVSFHPAGHILGSAQIRLEFGDGHVLVASGDYKRGDDPTCAPFEVVPCNTFITESTFAWPIYHWEPAEQVIQDLFHWWQQNAEENRPTLVFCYSLGKAQHILARLAKLTDQEIYIHGSIAPLNQCYEKAGVILAKTKIATEEDLEKKYHKDLILAPLSAYRSLWMRRFRGAKTAFVSGWMQVRGTRRRYGFDRGFVLSDHADWDDLIRTIKETQAEQIWVTHGEYELFSRYLNEIEKIEAAPLPGFVKQEVED